jgi:hypothetical protein
MAVLPCADPLRMPSVWRGKSDPSPLNRTACPQIISCKDGKGSHFLPFLYEVQRVARPTASDPSNPSQLSGTLRGASLRSGPGQAHRNSAFPVCFSPPFQARTLTRSAAVPIGTKELHRRSEKELISAYDVPRRTIRELGQGRGRLLRPAQTARCASARLRCKPPPVDSLPDILRTGCV